MKKNQTDPYQQIQPGDQPKDKAKGQATVKTNVPPEERPESANS